MRPDPSWSAPDERDGEIDLGRYLAALWNRWRIVALATVVAVVVAAAATLVLRSVAPRYEAESTVLLAGSKYRLTLDPKFTTVDTMAGVVGGRVDEYRAVAESGDVRRRAAKALGLSETELPPLRASVKGSLVTVTATSGEPVLAARAADAYAAAAAHGLEQIYGVGDQDQAALEQKLAEAVDSHRAAEARWLDFVRQSRVEILARDLAQKQLAKDTIVDEQSNVLRSRLASHYAILLELDRLARDAEALRHQVSEAGQSPASTAAQALALLAIESRLIQLGSSDAAASAPVSDESRSASVPNAARSVLPGQLQLDVDSLLGRNPNRESLLRDVDVLLQTAERRRTEFREQFRVAMNELERQTQVPGANIAALGDTQSDPTVQRIVERLAAQIQTLQAEKGQEEFRGEVLEQELELAKTTRTTLETKIQEASIAAATGGRAVVLSTASVPSSPASPPPLSRTLPLAAFLGLLIGAGAALWADHRDGARAVSPEAPSSRPNTRAPLAVREPSAVTD